MAYITGCHGSGERILLPGNKALVVSCCELFLRCILRGFVINFVRFVKKYTQKDNDSWTYIYDE